MGFFDLATKNKGEHNRSTLLQMGKRVSAVDLNISDNAALNTLNKINLTPMAKQNFNSSFAQNQEEALKTEFEEDRLVSSNVSHNIRDGESLCSDSIVDETSSEESDYYDEEEMEEIMNCRSKFTKMTVAQQSDHNDNDLNCMRSNSM